MRCTCGEGLYVVNSRGTSAMRVRSYGCIECGKRYRSFEKLEKSHATKPIPKNILKRFE